MKAAVISLQSTSSQWTIEAMRRYFKQVDDINLKQVEVNLIKKEPLVLNDGFPLDKYDCVYAKGSFRYLPLLQSITTALYKHSYMPIIPEAFSMGHDKLLTQLRLQQEGIPMPKTYLSATVDAAKSILEKVAYPIIMKFPQGTQGKGVMYADSYAAASSMLDALAVLKQPFVIQEYIETGGTDIRALVVGDKVVAAMSRKSVRGEKRANIHTGAVGESIILSPQVRRIAVDAAKAIGAYICGVDILEGPAGPLVIEVNLSPGLQGITESTKIDVADKIAKFLFEETHKQSKVEKKNGAAQIMMDSGIENSDKMDKEILTGVDLRANRLLLPEVVTKVAGFTENDELIIKLEKGKVVLEKFKL